MSAPAVTIRLIQTASSDTQLLLFHSFMTDANENRDALDAVQIASQTAALAAHLQRSGMTWIPQPNVGAVQSLAALMTDSDASSAASREAIADQAAARQVAPLVVPTTTIPPARPAVAGPPKAAPLLPSGQLGLVDLQAAAGSVYPGEPIPASERQAALDQVNAEVSLCTRCEILSSCRTRTVFGEGTVTPRVAFFGEGPGADEDLSGRPFVGRAGQLLTKMIEACKFRREDVYILNTVKCRPPGNRNPEVEEIANCREYYERQLAILRPEYIVCLGSVSGQELLRTTLSVGRLRGKFHRYLESKVLVTYHPAYLLRTPTAKKAAWEDLQLLLRDAGIQY
jgi:DNA polymerase